MEWYGSQNLRSKEVADYIDLFSIKQDLKRFYRPVKLINSPSGYDTDSKFKHVSEQLIDKGFKEIKSDYNTNISLEDDTLKYDIIFADLPINAKPIEEFIFDKKIKVGFEFNHLAKILSKLNENGCLFCLFPGIMLWGEKQKNKSSNRLYSCNHEPCALIRCRPSFDRRNQNRSAAGRIFDLLCEC